MIAVLGGRRQPVLPDVPTFAELGLAGFEDVPYYGFFAPAGTPQSAPDHFAAAVTKVLAIAEVRDRRTSLGLNVDLMPADALAGLVRAYSETWARIIKASQSQNQ